MRLDALCEDVASALVNHKLQRDLREQTIRDPLTGLFNRRYLEETLNVEITHAARSNSPHIQTGDRTGRRRLAVVVRRTAASNKIARCR